MNILLLIKDRLEAQGLKWMLTSQWNDVKVEIAEDVRLISTEPSDIYLYIVDLDLWNNKEFGLPPHAIWLGISSERTFQTVYHALSYKAEDVLFRPFQPERLIKQVQQIRFNWRNEQSQLTGPIQQRDSIVTYENFLLGDTHPHDLILMSIVVPSRLEELAHIVRELKKHDFSTRFEVFPFSDFVLVVHRLNEMKDLQEAYRVFFSQWKRQSDVLLTIYLHGNYENTSYSEMYKKMRRFYERIFYDGYDILSTEYENLTWSEMEPFLSPLEQRKWIEMLEKRNVPGIREWLEQDFLTLEPPYPNPEMVRVRLTSILAQIRRYMTAKSLNSLELEQAYGDLFIKTIREPVMYHIIQSFLTFFTQLLQNSKVVSQSSHSLVEKVRESMASNYWDASWNLAACAEKMKLHKSTLSRKFSKESGESFSEALLTIRIMEARRLLKETDVSIAEVSHLSGFTYPTYFSMKFKDKTGMSPYQFRQQ